MSHKRPAKIQEPQNICAGGDDWGFPVLHFINGEIIKRIKSKW